MRRNERGRPRDDVHIVPVGEHGVVFTAQETGPVSYTHLLRAATLGIPFPSRESTVRLLRWGNGIRPAVLWGRILFAPGGKGKGRNVPAFFRVLRGKRKGMGLVVRGEGGFC